MPENITNIVIPALFIGVFLLTMVCLLIRAVKNKRSPVRTVKATVIDKHKTESFTMYSGTGSTEKYVVVFLVGSERHSFYVSSFSFGGYKIGQSGKLRFKGEKIIGFR